ncbi:MAG: dihydroorotate dehydrogenase electron transfer subunit [Candidatus Margulisiibacteriota bacterium]
MPIQQNCRVLDHQNLNSTYFKLTLASDYISSHGRPGQFVEVRVSNDTDPLLRRPISLHRTDPAKKTFELLYEIVGQGTEMLSKVKIGEELSILGPLGSGFKLDQKIALLVAGGMGIAPLRFLAEQAIRQTKAVYVFIGAKTHEQVIGEDDFRQMGCQVIVATEDGSVGSKGLITDLLIHFIDTQLSALDAPRSTIYSCGPHAMLKVIAEIAQQKKIEAQVSLEAWMACGLGACKGCAIETNNGYKMVCEDGPVFDCKEIIW